MALHVSQAPQSCWRQPPSVEDSGLLGRVLPLHENDRYRGSCRCPGHWPGARDRAALPTLCWCTTPRWSRSSSAGGYGVDRRQIACNGFVIVGPEDNPAHKAPLPRRQQRHQRSGIASVENGWRRPEGYRKLVSRHRRRHGPGAEHGLCDACLYPFRSWHVAQLRQKRDGSPTGSLRHSGDIGVHEVYGEQLFHASAAAPK